MQVWQAILTKKVELDSRKLKSTISDSARDLLKVSLCPPSVKALTMHLWPGMLAGALHQTYAVGAWDVSRMIMLCMNSSLYRQVASHAGPSCEASGQVPHSR